jgi:hypothetical protein
MPATDGKIEVVAWPDPGEVAIRSTIGGRPQMLIVTTEQARALADAIRDLIGDGSTPEPTEATNAD